MLSKTKWKFESFWRKKKELILYQEIQIMSLELYQYKQGLILLFSKKKNHSLGAANWYRLTIKENRGSSS